MDFFVRPFVSTLLQALRPVASILEYGLLSQRQNQQFIYIKLDECFRRLLGQVIRRKDMTNDQHKQENKDETIRRNRSLTTGR